MEDLQIVELFFRRDEAAIAQLSLKYGKICEKTAYNITGNLQDSSECVNDAYLGVWNAIPPARPNPLLAFVLKIVRNISIDRVKYNTAKKRKGNYELCIDELEECVAGTQGDVEAAIAVRELTGYIEEFLSSVDELSRMIFVRRYWYMDSFEDIARMAGIRQQTARTRLSRTRKAFRSFLQERGVSI